MVDQRISRILTNGGNIFIFWRESITRAMTNAKAEDNGENKDNEIVTTITSGGQATIPKQVRDMLGLESPGKVMFKKTDEGVIVQRPKSPGEIMGKYAPDEGPSLTEQLREDREAETEEDEERASSFGDR